MTATGRLLATALILVLGGCGSGEPSASGGPGVPRGSGAGSGTASTPTSQGPDAGASPAPRTVTPADDGARFTMAVGSTTTLRVQPTAADPVVSGEAVLLVPVVNVTDSGVREWELRAVAAGTSTVTGVDPGYVITIAVG